VVSWFRGSTRWSLYAGQPNELTARWAGVSHPQIAFERHEPTASHTRTGRADGGRFGVDGGHAQQAAGRRRKGGGRRRDVAKHAGAGRIAGVPAEESLISVAHEPRMVPCRRPPRQRVRRCPARQTLDDRHEARPRARNTIARRCSLAEGWYCF